MCGALPVPSNPNVKRQQNCDKGEVRTQAWLLDGGLWVLKRRPDFEGADFHVQEPAASLQELRARRRSGEILGIVQSEFFENHNEVKVAAEYVEENGKALDEFFVSIHTDGDNGEQIDYFFTAGEVQKEFKRRTDRDGKAYYVFSLSADRDFAPYKNRPVKSKTRIILDGMKRTTLERNNKYVGWVFAVSRAPLETPTVFLPVSKNEYVMHDGEHDYRCRKTGLLWDLTRTDRFGTQVTLARAPGDPSEFDYNPVTDTWTAKSRRLGSV